MKIRHEKVSDKRKSKREKMEAAKRIIASEEEKTNWKEIEKIIAQGQLE